MANQTTYLSPVTLILGQVFTNVGVMAAGGQVFTYAAGTVNTLADTYADSTGTVKNPNPLTLNAAGRPVSASGAPVSFWTLPGVAVKLVVLDALGNFLIGPIDNIAGIDDLTNVSNALANLLASPTSTNSSGSGPVAGADLVANALKSYATFAAVRAANTPNLPSGATLIIDVEGAVNIGDGLGGEFYWNSGSVAVDDGRTVLKPASAGATGRWVRLLGLGQANIVVANADQNINNTTTLSNDAQLIAPMVAGGVYLVQYKLQFLGNTTTTQGYKVNTTYSGTLTGPISGMAAYSANAVGAAAAIAVNNPLAVSAISIVAGDACNLDFILSAQTSGNLGLQFAQNSSSANFTIRKAGSSLIVTRLS